MDLAHKHQEPARSVRSPRHLVSLSISAALVLGAFLGGQPAASQTLEPTAVQPTPGVGATAQERTDPNPGALSLAGGIDALNQSSRAAAAVLVLSEVKGRSCWI